jgi:magnesium transporter
MIKVRALRDGEDVEEVAVADLPALRAQAGTLIWVEVVAPTPAELAELGAEFGIHEVALEDLQVGERQQPEVEQYQDQVLLVFYGALTGAGGHPTRLFEVDLVAGQRYLLSFHGGGPIDPEPIARRVKARPELASEGAGYLLYVTLDELVDTFFPALDAIGERVVAVEETLLAGDTDIQAQIFAIREELITVRRVIGPMRDAMVVLASNRVNTVARNLAAYAAIFAVVTMISGIYGMNFHHMPEPSWRFGYGWALGLMALSAGGRWLYFKRKGWL